MFPETSRASVRQFTASANCLFCIYNLARARRAFMFFGSLSIWRSFSAMSASASSPVMTALLAWSSFLACSLLAMRFWKPPFLPAVCSQPAFIVACASEFLSSCITRWSPGLICASFW